MPLDALFSILVECKIVSVENNFQGQTPFCNTFPLLLLCKKSFRGKENGNNGKRIHGKRKKGKQDKNVASLQKENDFSRGLGVYNLTIVKKEVSNLPLFVDIIMSRFTIEHCAYKPKNYKSLTTSRIALILWFISTMFI